MQAKQAESIAASGSSRVIGGRSPWGGFLDVVCKKYGWTLDYVIWGVSYLNIQMMQIDEIAVYTDYGTKKQPALNGDDPQNAPAILSMVGAI